MGPFTLVDGMHRVTAMNEILNEYGQETFQDLLKSKNGFPCLIVRYDTPEYLITGFASRSNESNVQYTPMSWMDSLLNLAKFAMSYTEHKVQASKGRMDFTSWVAQPRRELFDACDTSASWSEFQKKWVSLHGSAFEKIRTP